MIRLSIEVISETLRTILTKVGFSNERAALCARLFAETSRDGVYSHGLNRFPRFIGAISDGIVDINAEPSLVESFGALERWDGRSGPRELECVFFNAPGDGTLKPNMESVASRLKHKRLDARWNLRMASS